MKFVDQIAQFVSLSGRMSDLSSPIGRMPPRISRLRFRTAALPKNTASRPNWAARLSSKSVYCAVPLRISVFVIVFDDGSVKVIEIEHVSVVGAACD